MLVSMLSLIIKRNCKQFMGVIMHIKLNYNVLASLTAVVQDYWNVTNNFDFIVLIMIECIDER